MAVFIVLVAGAFLILRPDRAGNSSKSDPVPAPPAPALPAPKPPLGRAELIEAAARAADAYATGQPAPATNAELAGRRFAVMMSFGCEGPGEAGEDAFWTYDEERGTLRVSVRPESWTEDETIRSMAGPLNFEVAEGFWISRPWIRTGGCPVPPPAPAATSADAPAPDAQEDPVATKAPEEEAVTDEETTPEQEASRRRLALVEFFAPGSRRAARRGGRPYTLTAKVAPGEIDLADGLRLVVEGRVAALPNGQPVTCSGDAREGPPLCLISVSISRVAITDPSGQRLLSEWGD